MSSVCSVFLQNLIKISCKFEISDKHCSILFILIFLIIDGMSFLYSITIIPNNWNMSQALREIFAKNLILLRTSRKLNREELSLLLGFDNSYISKAEKAKVNITIDKIEKIANYFEVSAQELFKKL